MNTDAGNSSESTRKGDVASLVLDLDFVPDWARQPPAQDPYRDRESAPERERAPGRKGPRGRDRRGGAGRDKARREQGRRDRGPRDKGGRRPDDRGRRQEDRARRPRRGPDRPAERLPFMVSFVPEQNHLATMVADIRAANHAFPLPELAHRFLNSPDWHLVKFEAQRLPGGKYAAQLFQSRWSGLLFVERAEAVKQVASEAMSRVFKQEVVQQDPPAGQFVCVARCGLSGELLGPPNHHDYKARVEELHRTRFAHMSVDDYRRQIETVHDPELIERWKEKARTRTVYRLLDAGDAAEAWDEAQARAYVEEQVVPKGVRAVTRAVLPGDVSREIRDPRLLRLLRAAWAREQRFPVTLVRALRGAFRRMGLHLFNTKEGATFVTAIRPRPIEPEQVVETIREVLEWLRAHPGCTRHELIHAIRPTAGEDPSRIGEVLQPLTWLVEKGHVIEFYNGTLATPKDAV